MWDTSFEAGKILAYIGEPPAGLLVLCNGRVQFLDSQESPLKESNKTTSKQTTINNKQ